MKMRMWIKIENVMSFFRIQFKIVYLPKLETGDCVRDLSNSLRGDHQESQTYCDSLRLTTNLRLRHLGESLGKSHRYISSKVSVIVNQIEGRQRAVLRRNLRKRERTRKVDILMFVI